LHKTSEAVNVVRVFVMNVFIDFEGIVEQVHSSVARSNHELPFDLFCLDLTGSFEEQDSLLEHVLLGIVHTQAGDDINLGWVVSVTLLVVVDVLELVLFLLVEVSHLSQDFRVSRDLGNQDIVPLQGLSSHTDELVHVSDLVDDLITVRNDGVKFLEGLKTLIVVVQSLVHKTQVVDSFNAIGFNTNGLKEEFFGAVVVFGIVKAVTLIGKSLGVVSVMLDDQVGEGLGIFEIVFEEVQERNVVRGHCHHDLVFLLEALEALNGLFDLLVFDEMDTLCDFHLTLNLRKVGGLEGFAHIVVTMDDILVDEWSHKLSSRRDVPMSILLLALKIFLKGISLTNGFLKLVLHLK